MLESTANPRAAITAPGRQLEALFPIQARDSAQLPAASGRLVVELNELAERVVELDEFAVAPGGIVVDLADDDRPDTRPGIGHHQIVENAARLIQQHGIPHTARFEVGDQAWQQGFQSLRTLGRGLRGILVRSPNAKLPHMRDVKQARACAGPFVLSDNPASILSAFA